MKKMQVSFQLEFKKKKYQKNLQKEMVLNET